MGVEGREDGARSSWREGRWRAEQLERGKMARGAAEAKYSSRQHVDRSIHSAESILRERREEETKRIRIAEVRKERELEKEEINISTVAGL